MRVSERRGEESFLSRRISWVYYIKFLLSKANGISPALNTKTFPKVFT